MYAIAPVSSLGAPTAPIRSVKKPRRPQSQPRLASIAMGDGAQEILALGYHETKEGAPPVPLIPARSPMRLRSSSVSSANPAPVTRSALPPPPPPPVPTVPATLKKRQIRTMRTTSARLVANSPGIPQVPPLPLVAPPRPPRPDSVDCLLSTSAPGRCMATFDRSHPPVPQIPASLSANAPQRGPSRRGHAYSNSTGSTSGSSSDSSGATSIVTPRQSEDSVEFRHVALCSSAFTATNSRTGSHKKSASYSQPYEVPSMSVFEESSDEDEAAHAHDRGASRKFRKGGLSLMSRSNHKHSNSKDGAGNTSPGIGLNKTATSEAAGRDSMDEFRQRVANMPGQSPTASLPGLSDGSESSSQPSAGERTPIDLDDTFSQRFGKNFTGKAPAPKPAHPDDELIFLMQSLKPPKRRESSARTRSNREKVETEGKSMSLVLPPINTTKDPLFGSGSLGRFMIH